jgi:hypothetical protein
MNMELNKQIPQILFPILPNLTKMIVTDQKWTKYLEGKRMSQE